ncbi:acetoacetate-CoA ligase [Cladophialophora psammophila CBS 110553]|uniref:Acetoacetate-CoA ligase n=1 Tax=Cladophialophora psammophila CBS 110553 TaxID=1182543 RepID=W9WEG3_9EURO|nr:acetoacetate-CoA ligase [Cladophialophora psammophila CBS 110553]EXJ63370.1 acetoacetate-CoA ligase [Cladophialophora psammophila CBS 110553]
MAVPTSHLPRTLWIPPDKEATNLDKFRHWVNAKHKLALMDYNELHQWSTSRESAENFWIDLFEFEKLNPRVVPERAFASKGLSMFPPPQFFPDITLNFTEHIFQNRAPGQVALYACSEGLAEITEIDWDDLYTRTKTFADALRNSGLKKGDRVAAVISNCVETIVACLAVLSIGAIFSTSSPDMGVSGIMECLAQIEPRFTIIESSVRYNGKTRTLMDKAEACLDGLRQIAGFQEMILIQRQGFSSPPSSTVTWEQFNTRATGRDLTYEQVPFNHPGFIVYSSGTTGTPKCIVHSAAGVLMKIKKDYMLNLDVRQGDTIYQYTTTGWVMWLMVLCSLSYGGKTVLYDGSPLIPDIMVTLRMVEKLKITLFGTSARFLSDLMLSEIKPRRLVDLSSLRTVSSTGSVLQPDVCEWFHDRGFPSKVHLVSGSGGTDLAGSLVNGDPTSPEYAGEIQRPALGMAIDILDSESDKPISVAQKGQPGELVCRMPFPSQPVKFWGSDGNKRYEDSYFSRYGRGIWHQGDFVSMSPITGGFTMLGRSDGVLNPSGVRFGSAEICNAISGMPEFEETICVGQRRPTDHDETVLLFVKMKNGQALTGALIAKTKSRIQAALTPRHVPKHIFEVPEIPYTINGKKIELVVKQIVSGRKVIPSGAVANPGSLKFYERFVDLKALTKSERLSSAKI